MSTRNTSFLQGALATVLLLLTTLSGFGQLKADFTIDAPGGCAPHAVKFTNKTTGGSASTTYTWSLGNGNTSTLQNPGATYTEEKKYTVTLTAKDGSQTSSKTLDVTVYKKPVVNFTSSAEKGCIPFPVEFTSTATAGDGTIANYTWDFGDGGSEEGASRQKVTHTYNSQQAASVRLIVRNSHGCVSSHEKPNAIEVLPALTAAFTAPKTVLCEVSELVTMQNNSSGNGNLSYSWDFGDGGTSTQPHGNYTYSKKGEYDVKLTVKNDLGCTAVSAPVRLNVANFTSNFTAPAKICENNSFQLQNTSTPSPQSARWESDNGNYAWSSGNGSATFHFTAAGKRTIKLTNTFGTCTQTVEKEVTVTASPRLNGFVVDLGACGAPVNVKFADTTRGAVKWAWDFGSQGRTANTKEASNTYTTDSYYYVSLRVENADGCSAATQKSVRIYKPVVYINLLKGSNSGCIGLKNTFGTYSEEEITEYNWTFGDGGTSTEKEPEHEYTKEGNFQVRLNFKTVSGCAGTAVYDVLVSKRPVADFTSDKLSICGNTPQTFTNTTRGAITYYRWYFEGSNGMTRLDGPHAVHQFQEVGEYTIELIAFNGNCSDTMVKRDYVKVLPGFADLAGATNTCDGTRGDVTLYESSRDAETYTWDFGDGTAPVQWTNRQDNIVHTYGKTGSYKVRMTITNGSCSVTDSLQTAVLLKQKPVLTASAAELCSSSALDIKITGLETNPRPVSWTYAPQYMISSIKHEDGSFYNGTNEINTPWSGAAFTGRYRNLDPNKKGIWVVTTSQSFGCYDTTNILPLTIRGPIAKMEVVNNNVCFQEPLLLADKSVGQNNVPIVKWEWTMEGGSAISRNTNDTMRYTYARPGNYYPQLRVTDAEGCFHSTGSSYVSVNGPLADFDYYPQRIYPQTTVQFYNTSNTYPYNPVEYLWKFHDGTMANGYSAAKYYPEIGTDTITMIARDIYTGCRDTIVKAIAIKDVEAKFNFSLRYLNNNCPPVVVTFQNQSDSYSRVEWDFGNGRTAGNLNNVSSTYENPGIYTATLYAYGLTTGIDSFKVPIEIKGPYAILSADTVFGCKDLSVQLSAVVRNATSFTWDFGDGTLLQTSDTFAVHRYATPGIYQPALILKDASGCPGTSFIEDKIVIDQLAVEIAASPSPVCDSAFVQITPTVTSLAASELGLPLEYAWSSGTGNYAISEFPSFYYNVPGEYTSSVKMISPFGCTAEAETTIRVVRKTNAGIIAPAEICEDSYGLFEGTASAPGAEKWTWDLGNGASSSLQNPGLLKYETPGDYTIRLILDHNGCSDTAFADLLVHARPNVNLTPQNAVICLGKDIQLQANDGVHYNWTAADGIANLSVSNPVVSPAYTTQYLVTVTNEIGCVSKDSTTITVGRPFQISLASMADVCKGLSVELPVTGADSYKWIAGTGLSSTTSNKPSVAPADDSRFTVVGYDSYNCFTDTAHVDVIVRPLPTVEAGDDISLPTGEIVEIRPSYSADVTSYNWAPQLFLNCTHCAIPTAAPKQPMVYTVGVENQYGCVAVDQVQIKLVCTENVSIPNAFTPNNDGKNDRFNLMGKGVRMVKSLRVFSRLGNVVYEKTNFQLGDQLAGWDGNVNGHPGATGTYVYFVEFICDSGELFARKGSVVLIR